MLKVTPWHDANKPTELALRRLLADERLKPYAWSNSPNDVYGVHEHSYDKVIYVVEGSITFVLPDLGERVLLGAGDRLDLPAGVKHGAEVSGKGVVCLEAHR